MTIIKIDKLQLVHHWEISIGMWPSNMTVYQTIRCSRSRYEKQWFHRPLILANFISNKLIFILVACASIYHAMRGMKSK